jgi:hypothetical protein
MGKVEIRETTSMLRRIKQARAFRPALEAMAGIKT